MNTRGCSTRRERLFLSGMQSIALAPASRRSTRPSARAAPTRPRRAERRGGPSGVVVRGGAVLVGLARLPQRRGLRPPRFVYPEPHPHLQSRPARARLPRRRRWRRRDRARRRASRRDAILPTLLDGFITRREQAKQRGDRHADQAIKIMMNALFGVLGDRVPLLHRHHGEIANAIVTLRASRPCTGRAAFEDEGLVVLYGDTDSVFVELRRCASAEATAQAAVEALRERVEARASSSGPRRLPRRAEVDAELEHVLRAESSCRACALRARAGAKSVTRGWSADACWWSARVGQRDWPRSAAAQEEASRHRYHRPRPDAVRPRRRRSRAPEGALDQ